MYNVLQVYRISCDPIFITWYGCKFRITIVQYSFQPCTKVNSIKKELKTKFWIYRIALRIPCTFLVYTMGRGAGGWSRVFKGSDWDCSIIEKKFRTHWDLSDVFKVHICSARALIQYLKFSLIAHFGGMILRIGFIKIIQKRRRKM